MANIENLSPERRKRLADAISEEAERIFSEAQACELMAEAKSHIAEILFGEADRLAPTVKEHTGESGFTTDVPEDKAEYIRFLEGYIIQTSDGDVDDQEMRNGYHLWKSVQPKAA
jgi:hypothetical protein